MSCSTQNSRRAVTLIELTILVAIIAILASISVPNFSRAQAWAEVARVKSDLRTLDTAISFYSIDNHAYPSAIAGTSFEELKSLTTPIAYITTVPHDIFRGAESTTRVPYEYVVYRFHPNLPLAEDWGAYPHRGGNDPSLCTWMEAPLGVSSLDYGWFAFSVGPDHDEEYGYQGNHPRCLISKLYDPTNGIISSGEIFRVGNDQPLL